jgi:hypothetical protein
MFIYLAYDRKLRDDFKDIIGLKNQKSNYGKFYEYY